MMLIDSDGVAGFWAMQAMMSFGVVAISQMASPVGPLSAELICTGAKPWAWRIDACARERAHKAQALCGVIDVVWIDTLYGISGAVNVGIDKDIVIGLARSAAQSPCKGQSKLCCLGPPYSLCFVFRAPRRWQPVDFHCLTYRQSGSRRK